MPTLTRLRQRALWGPLESTVPPITVPACPCMLSGRAPGKLGIYGFRNRVDHGYHHLAFAISRWVGCRACGTCWGRQGATASCWACRGPTPGGRARLHGLVLLAPSTQVPFTFPAQLGQEVQRVTGGYVLDVADFRTHDRGRVAQQVFDMTELRFALARHLATTRPWDFLGLVDMGPDRLHHGFWSHCEPDHPKAPAGQRLPAPVPRLLPRA